MLLCLFIGAANAGENCKGISLAVLGSGGPEIDDNRNRSGFAIRRADKGIVIVDAGAGTSWQFESLSLAFNGVKAVFLTHLHVDHVSDLATYSKGSFFTGRAADLHILGPEGNVRLPSVSECVLRMLGEQSGLYPT